MDLKEHIRSVPDFPRAGILFYDITTLLRDPQGFRMTIDMLSTPYAGQGIDSVVGIESRGFILGAAVAERIGAGFIPIRKPGKLPAKAIKETYDLEYGKDALEIDADAVDQERPSLLPYRIELESFHHERQVDLKIAGAGDPGERAPVDDALRE